MNEKINLKYGTEEVEVNIEGAASIESILPNDMPEIQDLKEAFIAAITTNVIGSEALDKIVTQADKITIVVSDITRSWMHQDKVVPLLVDFLHDKVGVSYENMCVLVALGTHRKSTPEELIKIASKEVCDKVQVLDHDCDADNLVYKGSTSRGTEVYVNALVENRKVIVLGGTVHHMMAGFGGGRKNLLPGIAGRETIRQNHRRALDVNEPHSYKYVGCSILEHNPINEDMNEAGALVHADFGINLVVAASGIHSGIFAGELDAAWKASCSYVKKCYEVPIDHQADVVVCSTGGYPKDMNLYQGCKGVLNALRALKPGGVMLWTCKCPEGGGSPDYFKWLEPLTEGHLDESLRADFTIGGYIFYLTVENIRKGEVYTLTELDPKLVAPMGLKASNDLSELLSKISFEGKSVYLLPHAGSVVPMYEGEDASVNYKYTKW